MKQTVVDVLMYLFENMIVNDVQIDPEREMFTDKLEQLGFPPQEIDKAFDWLEDLVDASFDQQAASHNQHSIRVYSQLECLLLDPECIGFLMQLEANEVLTPYTRELVLDRVIALDTELNIEQLKWIVLIVLYSYPGEENAYSWMESMIFEDFRAFLH